MLRIARVSFVVAGVVGVMLVATGLAIAQENANSGAATSPQDAGAIGAGSNSPSSATNPPDLPPATGTSTPQQAAAPVIDPQAAAQNAGQDQSPASGVGQDFPAPQRDESAAGARRNEKASLGVNVVSSNDGQGVIVSRVRPGTPADRMGLQPRDRILSLNGQPVVAVDEFIAAIRGLNVGEEAQLSIERGGEAQNIVGRLEALREAIAAGDGPVRNLAERTRGILGRERGERASVEAGPVGVNVQTGYEDPGLSVAVGSRDVDARITRLEQQIERLTQEIQQLRNSRGSQEPESQPGSSLPPASR